MEVERLLKWMAKREASIHLVNSEFGIHIQIKSMRFPIGHGDPSDLVELEKVVSMVEIDHAKFPVLTDRVEHMIETIDELMKPQDKETN